MQYRLSSSTSTKVGFYLIVQRREANRLERAELHVDLHSNHALSKEVNKNKKVKAMR